VTAGRERLTLFIASFASPNRSSMESIMPWSWTSASWMSCMEVSTPELSMMSVVGWKKGRKRISAPHKGRQANGLACVGSRAHIRVTATVRCEQISTTCRGPHVQKSKSLRLTVRNGQRWRVGCRCGAARCTAIAFFIRNVDLSALFFIIFFYTC